MGASVSHFTHALPKPCQSQIDIPCFCFALATAGSDVCVLAGLVRRIIVETDSTTIASRVSRPKADTTEIVINEQTIMNAYSTLKEKMQQRIQQL